MAGKRCRDQNRVQRRRFELVAYRSVKRRRVEEMIRVDCLRRTRIAIDTLRHFRCGNDGRMQERALADDAMRIGDAASQQERRRADRTAGRDKRAGADRQPPRRGMDAAGIHRRTGKRRHAIAAMREFECTCARDERRTAVERGRDRRDQH